MGIGDQFRSISYEQDGHIVLVTIRRPEVRNALHMQAHLELDRAWRSFEEDESAWVAILTGAGDQAFCAGADLKEARNGSPQLYWMTHKPGGFGGLTERFSLTKPGHRRRQRLRTRPRRFAGHHRCSASTTTRSWASLRTHLSRSPTCGARAPFSSHDDFPQHHADV